MVKKKSPLVDVSHLNIPFEGSSVWLPRVFMLNNPEINNLGAELSVLILGCVSRVGSLGQKV